MKPVDYTEFQKIKEMRGGNNDKIDNFKIDILEECALDIALTGPEKFRQKNWKKIMKSLTMDTSNNQMLIFQNIFY